MRQVTLHIGHGKTGSSAIQLWLSRNARALADHGYFYPQLNRYDKIASGLGDPNVNVERDAFETAVFQSDAAAPKGHTLLFSAEALFTVMPMVMEFFETHKEKFQPSFILYVRDPIEFCQSAYAQAVKAQGYTGSIQEYSESEYYAYIAAELHKKLTGQGLQVSLVNYTPNRKRVLESFLDTLGLTDLSLLGPSKKEESRRINRSLSVGETRFIREINQTFGPEIGGKVSQSLMHILPDVKSEPYHMGSEAQRKLCERLAPSVEYLNQFLPERDQLQLQSADEHQILEHIDETFTLTEAQILTICHSMAHCIRDGLISAESLPEENKERFLDTVGIFYVHLKEQIVRERLDKYVRLLGRYRQEKLISKIPFFGRNFQKTFRLRAEDKKERLVRMISSFM